LEAILTARDAGGIRAAADVTGTVV